MASLDVVNVNREKVGEVDLPGKVFEAEVNRALLHEVITIARSNGRVGTRGVKGRSDVSGGGRKPWRQKGTGRARHGSSRSPQWRGGGIVFGPQAHEYDTRIPRKKRQAALRSALSWKFKRGHLAVLEGVELTDGKTREVTAWLDKSGWREGGTLLVHGGETPLLSRAARNLARVKVTKPEGINLYDLFVYRHLVLTRAALEKLVEVWGK